MVTKIDAVSSQSLTSMDINLAVMAASVLSNLLIDRTQPEIQFHALRELIFAREYFGSAYDLSGLLESIADEARRDDLSVLIDKLNALLAAQ